MLRALSRVILQGKRSRSVKWGQKFYLNTSSENICRSFSVIRQQDHTSVNENTLSMKVLEYMRGSPEYATSLTTLTDQMRFMSPLNDFEIHQMLLVITDSKDAKPCDILMLFTQYISQKQYLLQDIVIKKKLMHKVKKRILQTIPRMTLDDLKTFAIILKYLDFKKSRYLIDIATCIDNECCRRASVVDLKQCLKLFDILLFLHGKYLCRKKTFDVFMFLFERHAAKASPHHLVQILHYIGVARKTRLNQEYVQLFITKLQEIFYQLSFIDAGIALEGIFKCSVKLDKSSLLLKKIAKCLETKAKKLEMLNDLELYAFVGMVKVIRAAKYKDETLLRSVSTFVMMSASDIFQPEIIAHILALYANSQMYDPDVFTKFECLTLKQWNGHLYVIRSKDINRILWSFSHVGHILNDSFFEMVEKILERLFHSGEFNSYPEHLSGSLFSLAVCGYYPRELIKEAFKAENIEKLQGKIFFPVCKPVI